jgi:ATP-dependent RNA/DNA helicase IGHMBP2
VIISTVLANDRGEIRFLKDSRRMNVAITRPKNGLIIFGDTKSLWEEEKWQLLITDYMNNGLVIKGEEFMKNIQKGNLEIGKKDSYNNGNLQNN